MSCNIILQQFAQCMIPADAAPVGPPPTTMKCSVRRMSASNVPGTAASSKQSWMRLRSAMVSLISCANVEPAVVAGERVHRTA